MRAAALALLTLFLAPAAWAVAPDGMTDAQGDVSPVRHAPGVMPCPRTDITGARFVENASDPRLLEVRLDLVGLREACLGEDVGGPTVQYLFRFRYVHTTYCYHLTVDWARGYADGAFYAEHGHSWSLTTWTEELPRGDANRFDLARGDPDVPLDDVAFFASMPSSAGAGPVRISRDAVALCSPANERVDAMPEDADAIVPQGSVREGSARGARNEHPATSVLPWALAPRAA